MLGTQVSTRLSPLFSLYRDALICVVFVMTLRIAFSGQTFDVEDRQLALLSLTSDSGNAIEQAIILFVFVNSLFLARLSRLPLRTIAFGMAPFAGLLLFALVSVLWSEYPWLTLRRALRFVTEVTTLNLLALTYRDECDRILRLFFRMFAVITVASFVSLAAPTFSFWAESFKGIFLQKLDAGRFFFFALPIFAIGIIDRSVSNSRLAAAALFLVAAGLLPITNAKTALVCVPLAILMTLSMRLVLTGEAYSRAALLVLYVLVALIATIVVYDMGLNTVFEKAFGDPTLTGRDNIWHFALDRFKQSPILGVGYGALWQTGPSVIQSLFGYNAFPFINQAHNGYIDILAQLGVAGLVVVVVFLVFVFVRLNVSVYRYEIGKGFGLASYGLYLLLGSVIYNFTDSTYLQPGSSLWIMLVFVSTSATGRLVKDSALFPAYRVFPTISHTHLDLKRR